VRRLDHHEQAAGVHLDGESFFGNGDTSCDYVIETPDTEHAEAPYELVKTDEGVGANAGATMARVGVARVSCREDARIEGAAKADRSQDALEAHRGLI